MFIEPHPPARLDWSGGQHSQHVVPENCALGRVIIANIY